MSESVVVNFGANALWQVHRFSSALLKALEGWAGVGVGGGSWLNNSLLRLAKGGYLKAGQIQRGVEEGGERGHCRVEGEGKVDGLKMPRCSSIWC